MQRSPEPEGTSAEELAYRLRQQELLAGFGRLALERHGFVSLLQEATRLCAEGLNIRYCKAMEYLAGENQFIVRAGVGWKPDVIGSRTGADLDSPTGYAFHRNEPVISSHLEHEGRFRTPQILVEHGIKRAINVPITTASRRYGVLEVDSPVESRFTEADIAFLQGFANLLGVALERGRGEERLRGAFAISTVGVMFWGEGFALTEVNDAFLRMTGFSREEAIGKTWQELTPEEFYPESLQAVEQVTTLGEATPYEKQYFRKDGSRWWGLFAPRRVGDEVVEFVIDVTDRREAEAALRRLNEELETRVIEAIAERERTEAALRQSQKLEAVGQLTGGVAHDFNNLLTIIRSSVEFLRRPSLPEERRRRYIDAITDTVDRAAKLTSQLLAFARRQALKPEVFDVPERVRTVTDMLRTIVGSRIRIVTDVACERCFVEADAIQFETALVNMAVNARDAMDGEGTLRIHVASLSRMPSIRGHAGGAGRFVAVSISDTGSGIPADRLGQIFEPFFTTKEVGKGTGLGLSQVYGFAKQSGGDVAVESEPGKGTTFTLYLPKVERDVASDETADHARGSLPDEDGSGRRVLVVEDNIEVGRFSTQLLEDLGYETTWAANASEALKLLEEDASRFDVVFSDVVMPGMSGVELGQAIRKRYPTLPVVLTSGYSHILAEEGRHGFELLHKPYAVEDVSRVLRRMTRRRGR